jgi:thiol-disulfide isomerase/thioredoxin
MSLFQLLSSHHGDTLQQKPTQNDEIDGGREAVVKHNSSEGKVEIKSELQPKWIVGRIFAEWCGHCRNMEKAWEELQNKIKEEKKGEVEFVEIEDIEMGKRLPSMNEKYFHKEGGKKGGIESSGFPTIFMFHVGKASETLTYYKGEREMSPMKYWIEDNMKGKLKGGKRRSRRVGKKGEKKGGKKGKTQRSKSKK